jgi:glycosidase
MNYPLAQAVLSFTGAGHLDEGVLRSHHEYGPNVHELDGVQFAARLETLMSAYAPEVVASQLNLLDSHDSPRFHSLVGGDRASYRLAVLLQTTLPGAPCIYYGDEVGLPGGIDPDCRRGFPAEAEWDRELLAFVRGALALRHAEPALRRGGFSILGAAGRAMAFQRAVGDQALLVALNAGESQAVLRFELPGAAAATSLAPVELPGLSAGTARIDDAGRVELELPARSGMVFRTA